MSSAKLSFVPTSADAPDARRCLERYFAELARLFPDGFDPGRSVSADPHETAPPAGQFLVVYEHAEAIGCGAIKSLGDGVAELKRMWVDPRLRGGGASRRLLAELEGWALRLGMSTVRLDTARYLPAAIAFYRKMGYREIASYNDNPYAHHWFEKRLVAAESEMDGEPAMDGEPEMDAEWEMPDVVELPIDGVLDLHPFDPRELKQLLPEYLRECRVRGILELRIIHGKGKGHLRRSVHALLERSPLVASYRLAGADAGSWGATLVELRPGEED